MILSAAARRFFHASGKLGVQPYITMFDDIVVTTLPSGDSYAYGGYVNGLWPTFPELEKRFPGHHVLDITVFASGNATCLDIENSDATIDQAPAWFERQVARGVYRPVLYISASGMKALERKMASCHIDRSAYRIWSAHYTGKPHICSPTSCGYGLTQADGTQWTDKALGLQLDQSLLLPSFFYARPLPPIPEPPAPEPTPVPVPAPAPEPNWLEAVLNALPTLDQGDKDEKGKPPFVRVMQGLIVAQGHANDIEAAYDLKVDGDFGPKTLNALLAIQEHFGLHDTDEYTQRVCGPKTWPVLVTGAK